MAFQRDSKLGYGYLLVGVAVPPLTDSIFGHTAGLVAYAICLVGGILFLLAAHHDHLSQRRSRAMTIFIFTLYGAVIGALGGGLTGALLRAKGENKEGSKSASAIEGDFGVQLSITCDNVALPMKYSGDLWILNTVMLKSTNGLLKYMPPPKNPEGLWPEDGANGFGYRCTVQNHGTQAAFSVSFPMVVSVLNIIRTGDTWTTGEVKETHTLMVGIPQPLGQQGRDQFSFYVCSYDPDGSLEVTLPATAFVNSDDSKNKREVPVKIASIAGNPFSVSPKNPFHFPPKPSVEPVERVVITNIRATHLAAATGENTTVFVHLQVNAPQALMVRMYQASAIQPFFADDGDKQKAVEEDLWSALIKNEEKVGAPLQLSANNQDVGFELAFKEISAEELNTLNRDQARYYFLAQLVRTDEKSVLDVCFSLNKDNTVRYCRGHNT